MRTDILERKEDILEWISTNQSKAFMCRKFRCKPETLNSYLEKLDISYAGNIGGKGIKKDPKRKTALEYVNSDSMIKSNTLKKKLIEDGIKQYVCEKCERSLWNGKQIPLELHHVDGNRFNNSFSNLRILCPNCHSQTGSNSGKNIGSYYKKGA